MDQVLQEVRGLPSLRLYGNMGVWCVLDVTETGDWIGI